ncbi:MAG TPA: hypothetical protein VEL07_04475 [Planctomycetota bacterium]|nr:hypothetical protein [Planctomycetota bacterium]
MKRILAAALVAVATTALVGADDVDKELGRWQDEIGKARSEYQTEVGRANDKAIKALVRIAQREVKAGDLSAATEAWRAVLTIDPDVDEARDFFTAIGQLDQVLAEIAASDDPLAGLGGGGAKPALIFSPGALLAPSGNVLEVAFDQRTIEVVVGKAVGDGVLYEEGNEKAGLAICLVGDHVRFVIAANKEKAELAGGFDRSVPWTHLAVQFDKGEVSLWIGGKLAQKARSALVTFPKHEGDGGLGSERRGSVADMDDNALSFRCAMFRLSKAARFTTAFQPASDALTDKSTLLAIGAENLRELLAAHLAQPAPAPPDEPVAKDAKEKDAKDEKPAKPRKAPAAPLGVRITAFTNVPDTNISWQVIGDVFVAAK